jgi:hypothetical protein
VTHVGIPDVCCDAMGRSCQFALPCSRGAMHIPRQVVWGDCARARESVMVPG